MKLELGTVAVLLPRTSAGGIQLRGRGTASHTQNQIPHGKSLSLDSCLKLKQASVWPRVSGVPRPSRLTGQEEKDSIFHLFFVVLCFGDSLMVSVEK